MERLLIVVSLAMAALSFQASAATLNLASGSIPNGLNADKWVLGSGDSNRLVFDIQGVKNNIFDIKVTLDNILLCFNNGGSRPFDSMFTEGEHALGINGIVTSINGGVDIRVGILTTKIPAAAWLFGSALLGLVVLAYHRKTAVFE